MWAQSLLPTIEELCNQRLINMDAIVETRVECPLDNKCLTANIVYKAVVLALSKPDRKYIGITETSIL